jgi:hypothetical protein
MPMNYDEDKVVALPVKMVDEYISSTTRLVNILERMYTPKFIVPNDCDITKMLREKDKEIAEHREHVSKVMKQMDIKDKEYRQQILDLRQRIQELEDGQLLKKGGE